jgi:tRNA (guanine6-N2)-methyltransferase
MADDVTAFGCGVRLNPTVRDVTEEQDAAVGPAAGASMIARSAHGLEWVVAAEVCALIGTEDGVGLARREVTFGLTAAGPELLGLRTADDVFLAVGVVSGVGSTKDFLPALGHAAANLDWASALLGLRAVRQVPGRPRFDVVASIEGHRTYNRFAVEASVGSALAPVLRAAFLERVSAGRIGGEPDFTVRVFVRADRAILAIRLGSRPLHRRVYKTDTGLATLHPPAAAALAAISAPETGLLLDPFCGDGTIAIEAALARPVLRVVASDIDPQRVENTRRNARRAGADIDVSMADAGALEAPLGGIDAVVTNPPWSLAVDWSGQLTGHHRRFWDELAPLLAGSGILCSITDVGLDVPGLLANSGWAIGLRQQIRLAGRVADVLLASPGTVAPRLPPPLERWRLLALEAGIVTEAGF